MSTDTSSQHSSWKLPSMKELRPMLEPYIRPRISKGAIQLANTFIPYLVLWYLMWRSLAVSYWLTLLLSIVAGGFLVRIFIFFHDCGHNSFFPSTQANRKVGFWLGLLVFTPSEQWWHAHAIHHATSSNLDRRGIGDVKTLTVAEYLAASWWQKLWYRIIRNPFFFLGFGPVAVFLLANRLPNPRFSKRETLNVVWTNLGIIALAAVVSLLIGFKAYVLIQLPVIWIAGTAGIWMFYVQHQFEDMYWANNNEWEYISSALQGASYYRLPGVLRWFTGNIGFHHIHHLNPRIPNYELDHCYYSNPTLQTCVKTISFKKAFPCLFLNLWDEEQQRMIGFKDIKQPHS
ncbi:MAG: fatty acid desaturase [Anaerolineaceae bacterium]|nr:fatty acid desaturase [Anaerolineaceae bacterium]